MPVFTRVSQATRLCGSEANSASRMASEIWSHILSGCPSETDSEVKRNSLSAMSSPSPHLDVSCWFLVSGFWSLVDEPTRNQKPPLSSLAISFYLLLIELRVNQPLDRLDRLGCLGAGGADLDYGTLRRRQHHQTDDALAVHELSVLLHGDLGIILRSGLDELGRGARV